MLVTKRTQKHCPLSYEIKLQLTNEWIPLKMTRQSNSTSMSWKRKHKKHTKEMRTMPQIMLTSNFVHRRGSQESSALAKPERICGKKGVPESQLFIEINNTLVDYMFQVWACIIWTGRQWGVVLPKVHSTVNSSLFVPRQASPIRGTPGMFISVAASCLFSPSPPGFLL